MLSRACRRSALENAPLLERLKKKGFQVIFMKDPVDEYMVQQMRDYDGKKLVTVTKEGLKLEETDEEKKEREEHRGPLQAHQGDSRR